MNNSFSEGTVVRIPFLVTEQQMMQFGLLSGDLNPLHCDEVYAKNHGFKGRVVYGGLLTAVISRLLGMELPGQGWMWHSLSLQFKAPLYINQTAEVIGKLAHVNSAFGVITIKIEIRSQDKLLAEGEVQSGILTEQKVKEVS